MNCFSWKFNFCGNIYLNLIKMKKEKSQRYLQNHSRGLKIKTLFLSKLPVKIRGKKLHKGYLKINLWYELNKIQSLFYLKCQMGQMASMALIHKFDNPGLSPTLSCSASIVTFQCLHFVWPVCLVSLGDVMYLKFFS